MDDNELYPIGDVGRRTGLSVSAIRFYADAGIVPPTRITDAGYRLYDIQAIARLEFVRTLRELGTGLEEIRRLLTASTSLRDLAAAHLTMVEAEGRRLRIRRAVLRTIVRQDSPAERVALMHKLVSMADEERERLIDQFWDEVTEGLPVHPAFVELMRRNRPRLPAEPTTDQLEAWIEVADLVRDESFRESLRAAFRNTFSSGRSHAATSPEVLDHIERHRQILMQARTASEAGLPAESRPARELADRLAASAADISAHARSSGLTGPPRPGAMETHGQFMGLLTRYSVLVATVNGTPRSDPADAIRTRQWLAEAGRGDG